MANQKQVKVDPHDVDVIVGMDCSGSMGEGSDQRGHGPTRWQKGEESMSAIAEEMSKYDDDGLTVFVFNDRYSVEDGVTPERVAAIFQKYSPNSGTRLAPPLQNLIDKFLPAKKSGGFLGIGAKYNKVVPAKPVCFLIFTDGCPQDQSEVASVIADATERTDQGNVGFLFIQVGHDEQAEQFLAWLDTNLKAQYDCVSRARLEQLEKLPAAQLIEMAFNGTDNS